MPDTTHEDPRSRSARSRPRLDLPRDRHPPQAPAGALVPAPDGHAAPLRARPLAARARLRRASSRRSSPRSWSRRSCATATWAWEASFEEAQAERRVRLPRDRAAVRPLRAVRRALAASRPAADRLLALPGDRRRADLRAGQRRAVLELLHLLRDAVLRGSRSSSALRWLYERVTGVLLRAAGYRRRAVLVGSGKHIEDVHHALVDEVHAPVDMIGFISLTPRPTTACARSAGSRTCPRCSITTACRR